MNFWSTIMNTSTTSGTPSKTRTPQHLDCLVMLREHAQHIDPDNQIACQQMLTDINNIDRLGTRHFNEFLHNKFNRFSCKHVTTHALLVKYAEHVLPDLPEVVTSVSDRIYVQTKCCGACERSHLKLPVILKPNKAPFVYCPTTNKRIEVVLEGQQPVTTGVCLENLRDAMYHTVFTVRSNDPLIVEQLVELKRKAVAATHALQKKIRRYKDSKPQPATHSRAWS